MALGSTVDMAARRVRCAGGGTLHGKQVRASSASTALAHIQADSEQPLSAVGSSTPLAMAVVARALALLQPASASPVAAGLCLPLLAWALWAHGWAWALLLLISLPVLPVADCEAFQQLYGEHGWCRRVLPARRLPAVAALASPFLHPPLCCRLLPDHHVSACS